LNFWLCECEAEVLISDGGDDDDDDMKLIGTRRSYQKVYFQTAEETKRIGWLSVSNHYVQPECISVGQPMSFLQ
jgi:hypothetical protein